MPRLRNSMTGVVVNVDDATAGQLGSEWGPAGRPASDAPQPDEKPAQRRTRKTD
jgi:hypothetical protein